MSSLLRYLSPEEQELEKKQVELAALEAELAQRELVLATMRAEFHTFEREYYQVIGTRFTELDRIERQISEYMEYLEAAKDFKPSDSLKKLYREVAKKIHPDLATDEAERLRRQELMAEANTAYEAGDEERLRSILNTWEISPESAQGEGIAVALIRVIRKIAQVQNRLRGIEEESKALEITELGQLKTQVETAKQAGQDLLAEMAKQLDEQIQDAQKQLQKLKDGIAR
jgi:DnaJ-domain-containing protein 1